MSDRYVWIGTDAWSSRETSVSSFTLLLELLCTFDSSSFLAISLAVGKMFPSLVVRKIRPSVPSVLFALKLPSK